MEITKPLLSPACLGWQKDLPCPEAPPEDHPSLGLDTPNYQDNVFLEVSRCHIRARGFLLFINLIMIAATFCVVEGTISSYVYLGWGTIALSVKVTLIGLWVIAFCMRAAISPPRDLPLRFNRVRQRMYAYNLNSCWWNPFEKWEVVPVAYDWSQVRAERWKTHGISAQGKTMIKWGVVLSIVKPKTNQVIDRFPLSTMGADEFAWSYICTYMQQGPSALPPPDPPRDHNDVPWYNLALRLAPKVQWPDEMDRESRTAP